MITLLDAVRILWKTLNAPLDCFTLVLRNRSIISSFFIFNHLYP